MKIPTFGRILQYLVFFYLNRWGFRAHQTCGIRSQTSDLSRVNYYLGISIRGTNTCAIRTWLGLITLLIVRVDLLSEREAKKRLQFQCELWLTLVFRARQVSHAREARGARRCEAHRALPSGASMLIIDLCTLRSGR